MRARVTKFAIAWLASGAIAVGASAASILLDPQSLDAHAGAAATGDLSLRQLGTCSAAAYDFRFLSVPQRGLDAAAALGNESLQADITASLTVVPFPPTLLMGSAGLLSVIGVHLRRRGK